MRKVFKSVHHPPKSCNGLAKTIVLNTIEYLGSSFRRQIGSVTAEIVSHISATELNFTKSDFQQRWKSKVFPSTLR